MTDTIYAPATAPGRAAVAVVRLSGPATGEALKAMAGRLPFPRRASVRRLKDAAGVVFDEALVLWMPGTANYTGEDSAELQLHGGPAVVEAAINALAALNDQGLGLRLAEPGEFTRRAFENGRLDLAQAEAVADLVDAETQAQARQALAQLEGGLSRRYDRWRDILVEALAVLEAAVDFPDEDLPEDVAQRARPGLTQLLAEIEAALTDADRGRQVREGYRIALVGAPNAGKSTLLNALARRDAAIVTATPGTTRDIIEVPLILAGYKVLLADTAGMRDSVDPIEMEGVRRARAWAQGADLRILLADGSGGREWEGPAALGRAGDLLVRTKADLGRGSLAGPLKNFGLAHSLQTLAISVTGGQGLEALETALEQRVVTALSGADLPAATRLRHVESLTAARDYLDRALAQTEVELAAEDVRLAARALGRVTGRVDVEDVLDRVFSSFCIGK
jgi:tRNA modification GTPase